ncbi:MAG: FAD-binding oxidoreductase [Pseudomonadota bacterium]
MTGYLTANDRPAIHADSWYAASAGPIPERPRFEGEQRADVAVIGAGYAGLSAALHLAERGMDVVVLEANRVGWGASGRNGGQLGVGPRAPMEEYERALGTADARRVWDIALAANALIKERIARHAIDCDLRAGHLEAAWRASDAAELEAWPDQAARAYGHGTARYMDRDDIRAMLGTERYHGGVVDTTGGHLHPLKLAKGLAAAAEAAGVRILEASPARRVGQGRVETAHGVLRADHVLLACNGYIDGLVARVQRRVMPINNFIVATEPLDEATARRINRDNLCVSDSKFVLNYFRLSPDRRMLWGGGESYGRRFPKDIAGLVRRTMAEVYPELAAVPITHAWGGTLAITGTRMPAFQRLEPALWSISGWSGSGIHMATIGGQIAAEAIAGTMKRWDLMARLPTPAFPGGDWFRFPLLALAMTWYSLRDRL